jgi:hypothetical protein
MTLGFISLLLTVMGRYISRICIPEGAADTMLPCSLSTRDSEAEEPEGHGRRHLSEDSTNIFVCSKVSDKRAVVVFLLYLHCDVGGFVSFNKILDAFFSKKSCHSLEEILDALMSAQLL